MQRWIVIGSVLFVLMLGGGGAAVWAIKRNKPDKQYYALPLDATLPPEKKADLIKQIREKLFTDKVMASVAKDAHVKEYLKLASDAEAVAEVKRRAFVQEGKDGNSKAPSIQVGFIGQRKEKALLESMANSLDGDLKKLISREKPADDGF